MVFLTPLADAGSSRLVQFIDINVRDPGVSAFGFPFGPAHNLHAFEVIFRGEPKDIFKGFIREYGAYESKVEHKVDFFGRYEKG